MLTLNDLQSIVAYINEVPPSAESCSYIRIEEAEFEEYAHAFRLLWEAPKISISSEMFVLEHVLVLAYTYYVFDYNEIFRDLRRFNKTNPAFWEPNIRFSRHLVNGYLIGIVKSDVIPNEILQLFFRPVI